MAPPPEYDKEPKAPDKSATIVANEDSKVPNVINDSQTNSDHNSADSAVNSEVEKLTDNLDDLDEYQLRDLLDEAILYKSPKDRRGKSRIFQGLLDEVEHLDEISEATARSFLGANRPNSLHDLIAVMKDSPSARLQVPTDVEADTEVETETEAQPHTKVEPKALAHSPISSLAIQDNNLPADVDTSIVAEEPASGGYFAATVKCFNPPPLAERRVTAADASCPAEMELLNKRSKSMFPMYTARATLEIGSGSVGSGRAVTTTTASNQVRTRHPPPAQLRLSPALPAPLKHTNDPSEINTNQKKLMRALYPQSAKAENGGGTDKYDLIKKTVRDRKGKKGKPRGPKCSVTEDEKNLNTRKLERDKNKTSDRTDTYDPITKNIRDCKDNKGKQHDPKCSVTGDVRNLNTPTRTLEKDENRTNNCTDTYDPITKNISDCKCSVTGDVKNLRHSNTTTRKLERDKNKTSDRTDTYDPVTKNIRDCKKGKPRDPKYSVTEDVKNLNTPSRTLEKHEIKTSDRTDNYDLISKNIRDCKDKTGKPRDPKYPVKEDVKNVNTASRILEKDENKNSDRTDTYDLISKNIRDCKDKKGKQCDPKCSVTEDVKKLNISRRLENHEDKPSDRQSTNVKLRSEQFLDNVDRWYKGLSEYVPAQMYDKSNKMLKTENKISSSVLVNKYPRNETEIRANVEPNIEDNYALGYDNLPLSNLNRMDNEYEYSECSPTSYFKRVTSNISEKIPHSPFYKNNVKSSIHVSVKADVSDSRLHDIMEYRKRVGRLERASSSYNPRNFRNISIGQPIFELVNNTELVHSTPTNMNDIELEDISHSKEIGRTHTFSKFVIGQKQLLKALELTNHIMEDHSSKIPNNDDETKHELTKECKSDDVKNNQQYVSTCDISIEENKHDTPDLKDLSRTDFKTKNLNSNELNVLGTIDEIELSEINSLDVLNMNEGEHTMQLFEMSNSLKDVNSNEIYTLDEAEISQKRGEGVDVNSNAVRTPDTMDTKEFFERSGDLNIVHVNSNDVAALDNTDTIEISQTSADLNVIDVNSNEVDAPDNIDTLELSQTRGDLKVTNLNRNEIDAPDTVDTIDRISTSQANNDLKVKDMNSNEAGVPHKIDTIELYQTSDDLKVKKENSYKVDEPDTTGTIDISQTSGDSKITNVNNNEVDTPDTINTIQFSQTSVDFKVDDVKSNELNAKYTRELESQIDITDAKKAGEPNILPDIPNNAYIFLSLPKRLIVSNNMDMLPIRLQEIENNISVTKPSSSEYSALVKKKKQKVSLVSNTDEANDKKMINRNSLKVLLFKSLFAQDSVDKSLSKPRVSAITEKEVDAAIPFSSIITPEVVASCNTTSSTSQSAVAVDPKPLQLSSCYRAVTCITGAPPAAAATASPTASTAPASLAAPAAATNEQPRSVISSTFNGLPLSRPNYGATASAAAAAADEYKKSLDENGNAVQGIGSPVSGSSQHKKPRRKKSSKNETVIKSHQIDGYQGNKDLNEVLRFIESNADGGRGAKLPRAKHKDDADDKTGKKRSAERRKDKDAKPKRATSMEELSRTKLEDLTDAPEPPRAQPPPAKPERRSWGDGARDYFRETEPAAATTASAAELTDFQTVTKRRKPRRRADDGERDREPARRTRPPDRSDRSNDSNDDMDSVHSLPPAAPRAAPPAAHASYADIARTRHNIPDLIESCNFYAEGEGGGLARRPDPAPAPIDADGYPALGGVRRAAKPPPPAAGAGAGGARPARDRGKERAAAGGGGGGAGGGSAAAPDVVADRRPPVILLDSAARPRDMDGVTFGFDINEQLLGPMGGARRPRCDLVREAAACDAAGAVPVRAGGAALRYVPPDPPPDDKHLHQIVDYVGSAWEDVVRCGGGEVRYFSE